MKRRRVVEEASACPAMVAKKPHACKKDAVRPQSIEAAWFTHAARTSVR